LRSRTDSPIYAQIALDVAVRIARGELKEGAKIMGRSTLASEYKVSPETIRRALSLLDEMAIVEVLPGSGVVIRSQEAAAQYVEKHHGARTVLDLRNDILRYIDQKAELERAIVANIDKIIDYSERLRNLTPIYPLEFEVPDDSPLLGRMVQELKLWQCTGATLVAIRRSGRMIISPGPLATFEKGDVILAVGDPGMIERMRTLLATGK